MLGRAGCLVRKTTGRTLPLVGVATIMTMKFCAIALDATNQHSSRRGKYSALHASSYVCNRLPRDACLPVCLIRSEHLVISCSCVTTRSVLPAQNGSISRRGAMRWMVWKKCLGAVIARVSRSRRSGGETRVTIRTREAAGKLNEARGLDTRSSFPYIHSAVSD